MHCEIIDPYFNIFLVEIQLKKQNLKSVTWAPGCSNQSTSLPNSQDTSLLDKLVHNKCKALQVCNNQQVKKLILFPPEKQDVTESEAELQSLRHVDFVTNLSPGKQEMLNVSSTTKLLFVIK